MQTNLSFRERIAMFAHPQVVALPCGHACSEQFVVNEWVRFEQCLSCGRIYAAEVGDAVQ